MKPVWSVNVCSATTKVILKKKRFKKSVKKLHYHTLKYSFNRKENVRRIKVIKSSLRYEEKNEITDINPSVLKTWNGNESSNQKKRQRLIFLKPMSIKLNTNVHSSIIPNSLKVENKTSVHQLMNEYIKYGVFVYIYTYI